MIASKELRRHLHMRCKDEGRGRARSKRLLIQIERRRVLSASIEVVPHCSNLTALWAMAQSRWATQQRTAAA
jgi:hypothetical protein